VNYSHTYLLKNIDLTKLEELAKALSSTVSSTDIIFLNGEIGSGKTTFTQFLLKHLGVKEKVDSPTFVIAKLYTATDFSVIHLDGYRLTSADLSHDFSDYINLYLTIVEWPNNIFKDIEPTINIEISTMATKKDLRIIKIYTQYQLENYKDYEI